MISRQRTRSLIASEFPGRDSLIDHAYRESRSFRDLCRDYRRCAEALDRWRRSDGDSSSSRAREYAELLSQLGSEIASWLEAEESRSMLSRRGRPR
jgi:hypothetical protein